MTILLLTAAFAVLLGAVGVLGLAAGAEDRPGFSERVPLS